MRERRSRPRRNPAPRPRPHCTEAPTIPNDDSARILAAAGWQSDPRRLPMLQNLLREHLKQIYLYSYEESRNRAAAIDRTRRTLLRVARTVQFIPAGCPFVTWVFLALEEARVPPAVDPDFWRLLVIAEDERRSAAAHVAKSGAAAAPDAFGASTHACAVVGEPAVPTADSSIRAKAELAAEAVAGAATDATTDAASGVTTSTASHPMLRPMVSLYRRFLDVPESGAVEPRANWPAAAADLDCFLRAQFAETGDATCHSAPVWRRWLATRPWRRPRNIAAAAMTVVVVAVAFVVGFTLVPPKGRRATFPGSARTQAADPARASRSGGGVDSARASDNPGTASPEHASAPTSQESISRGRFADCQIASAQAVRGLLDGGNASVRINGARCERVTRDSLCFAWMPAQGITEYRLCLITAKRDTLGIVPAILGACVIVPVKGVPLMAVPGSFIFRVDGLAGGRLVAVSDPQPFEIP